MHKRDEDVRVHVEHRAWARPAGGRRSLSSLLRLLQAGKVDVERLPLRPLLDLRTRLYISTLLLAAGRDSRSLLLRQALCDGRDARSLLVLRRGLAALALHFVFVMLWHCGRTCSVRTRCERCASMVASKFLQKGGALPADDASAAAAGSTAGRNEGCSTESAREGK